MEVILSSSYYLTRADGRLFPIALQEPVAMKLHKPFTLGQNKEKRSKESVCCFFCNACVVIVLHCRL